MKSKNKTAILYAILAAALFALNSPVSKLLLKQVPQILMAALLYFGAGFGMVIIGLFQKIIRKGQESERFAKNDLPYIIAMALLDIAAPISLMYGLSKTTAANASLLGSFEIVATSVFAYFIFKEAISKRLFLAIILVVFASIILFFEDIGNFTFSLGSLFVLMSCVFWGFENNCTKKLSCNNPLKIVVIKGFGSGLGSLIIAIAFGQTYAKVEYVLAALVLGFVSYGLSILFYVYAQRSLGAAKTSAYYAIAPFIGVVLSLVIFKEIPSISFVIALAIMLAGTYFASTDKKDSLKLSV